MLHMNLDFLNLNISFDFEFTPLLIVMAIAWAVPMTMSLFRLQKIPTVIIEIIIGFIVGKYLLNSFSAESIQVLDFLALTGFIFLMFLSGLEIDVDQILVSLPRRKITYARFIKNPFLVGFAFFVATLILSYLSAYLLSYLVGVQNIWYFSLIMVTTSVGIIVPVLKSRGEISSRFGQMIISAAAIADILSISLFAFTAFILKNGFKYEILLILALFIIFYLFYNIGKQLKKGVIFNRIIYQLSHAASQITIRGTFLLILVFVVISQYIGEEEMLLGAFLCGLLLSIFLHKDRSVLILKLDGMGYGFFIPIFFIMVGATFDTSALAEFDDSLFLFLGLLLVTLFLVKVIPSFLWFKLFGRKRAISGGFLMSSRLSLIIAASQIGLDIGVVSPGVNACFIIMAVASCFLSPIIYSQLNPKTVFQGEKTIIVGGSSTGVLLARRLTMHGKHAIILEKRENRCREMKSKGLDCILCDAKNTEIYEKIKLRPADYVVVIAGSDFENLQVCENIRKNTGHERIISLSVNSMIEQKLAHLEVELLDRRRIIATTIETLIFRPSTYHALIETFENFSVMEFKVVNSDIDGKKISDIPFHRDGVLMLIKRGNNMLVPHGDNDIKLGDIITIFGTDSAHESIRTQLS